MLADALPLMRGKAKPGTFTIIHGNHTLYRVTDIGGTKDRISLILAYEENSPASDFRSISGAFSSGPIAPGIEASAVIDQATLLTYLGILLGSVFLPGPGLFC